MFGWFKKKPHEVFAGAVYGLDRAFPYKTERRETLWSVPFCIARNGGDCDDKADMWYRALKAWGFSPRVVHGEYKGVLHAAVLCRIGGEEYVFCNAHGRLAKKADYLGGPMRNYRVLTDEQYQEWCRKYSIDRI